MSRVSEKTKHGQSICGGFTVSARKWNSSKHSNYFSTARICRKWAKWTANKTMLVSWNRTFSTEARYMPMLMLSTNVVVDISTTPWITCIERAMTRFSTCRCRCGAISLSFERKNELYEVNLAKRRSRRKTKWSRQGGAAPANWWVWAILRCWCHPRRAQQAHWGSRRVSQLLIRKKL